MRFVFFAAAVFLAVVPLMGHESGKGVPTGVQSGVQVLENGDGGRIHRKAVRKSVREFLEKYPQATLQDIYKNNFQDYFGPAHIMADREGVLRYLNWELAQMDQEAKELENCGEEKNPAEETLPDKTAPGRPALGKTAPGKTGRKAGGKTGRETGTFSRYYDPCGWRHNYYQVSLKVIREGMLSVEEFADAFMAGGGAAPEVTGVWLEEWEIIKWAVKKVAPDMDGFEADAAKIDALLRNRGFK